MTSRSWISKTQPSKNMERKQDTIISRVVATLKQIPHQSSDEISSRTGVPLQQVRNALTRLHRDREAVCEMVSKRGRWRLEKVKAEPGEAKPDRINKMDGYYTCPELQRSPGIHQSRFAAFDLPSRIGDRLYYRDGRVEVMA
jgi:hypothetical protein